MPADGSRASGRETRNHIAALDAATGEASSWDPGADSTVSALAVNGSTIYAAGGFKNIGGQTRRCIAALDADTGTATSWNPETNENSYISALTVSGATVYAGGGFTSIGGQDRTISRLWMPPRARRRPGIPTRITVSMLWSLKGPRSMQEDGSPASEAGPDTISPPWMRPRGRPLHGTPTRMGAFVLWP